MGFVNEHTLPKIHPWDEYSTVRRDGTIIIDRYLLIEVRYYGVRKENYRLTHANKTVNTERV
jgi:hypothetical protein